MRILPYMMIIYEHVRIWVHIWSTVPMGWNGFPFLSSVNEDEPKTWLMFPKTWSSQDINQMHPRYQPCLGYMSWVHLPCLGCIYHVLGRRLGYNEKRQPCLGYITMSWVHRPCLGYIDHVLGTFRKMYPTTSKMFSKTCIQDMSTNMYVLGTSTMSWVHRPCLGYIDHVLGNNMISWAHLAYRGHTAWYRGYMYWCRGCI